MDVPKPCMVMPRISFTDGDVFLGLIGNHNARLIQASEISHHRLLDTGLIPALTQAGA
jgi:hypothetical protein